MILGTELAIRPVSSALLLNLGVALSLRRPLLAEAVSPRREEGSTIRELARQVLQIRHALERVRLGARMLDRPDSGTVAAVRSSSPLGLSLQAIPATLSSREEVNRIPTSYSPFAPSFSGGSTATPIIGGIYDGSNGDDTLTFNIKKGGVVGADNINLEVRDGSGKKIDNLTFNPGFEPGTEVSLSNGLTFTLTAGTVDRSDSFELDVFATGGSSVIPYNPFNGTGNDRPNLDPGLAVTAGSFDINGAEIVVEDTDSLNDVLDKITASDAGVVATFDAATERVILTQESAGPGGHIVLGGDDTGFFDAVKLSGAVAVPGADNQIALPIAQVPQLAGISDGDFSINGVLFTADTSTDTFEDVIARINASSAGVTATFDQTRNELDIVANGPGASLDLKDGTSGFFSGVKILPGFYSGKASESKPQGSGLRFVHADELPRLLKELGASLQSLFTSKFDWYAGAAADRTIQGVESAVRSAFRSILDDTGGDRLRSGLGIDFDFREGSEVFRADSARLTTAIARHPEALADFLLSEARSQGRDGLLVSIDRALEEAGDTLSRRLDPVAGRGLILNLLA